MAISATKPKLNPSSEYPYTLLQAVHIDDLATKKIQTHCNTLDSHGLKLLMAPEIEVFFENSDHRDKTIKALNNSFKQQPFLYEFFDRQDLPKIVHHVLNHEISKDDINFLELFFAPMDTLNFLKTLNDIKNFLKKTARIKKFNYDLLKGKDSINPSFHINFSVWKDDQNIFSQYQKIPRIINFILNRLAVDIKETAFVFASGSQCLSKINRKHHLSPKLVEFKESKNYKENSCFALPLRDSDKTNEARVEIRRFNDNSGIQSLKALLIVKSITDSIDKIISLTDASSFNNLQDLNDKLESEDNTIRLSDNSQNEDYKFSYIFPPPGDDNKSGRQTLLERFRSSCRAKEIFGDELHARICEADFTLVG